MTEASERSGAASAVEGPSGTLVGAIDQGTTGTRFMLFDDGGQVLASAYRTHEQYFPKPGWVEHDPVEIWENTKGVVTEALASAGVDAEWLDAIGIANQRETTLLWEAETGEPVGNAIVWQDRRTSDRIDDLEAAGKNEWIRETTGLEPDEYFSATKLEWCFENEVHFDGSDGGSGESGDAAEILRDRAADGDVLFGTVDSWLVYNLTGVHATDVTNASRTMLFDVADLAWDEELLAEFGVPTGCLPDVYPSSDPSGYGHTDPDGFLGARVPVTGVLGDQQAALFGQTCFDPGDAKNTYGTGSFLLLNTGTEAVCSEHGLLTTVAYQRAGEPATYALEGSIFVTGGAIEWLVDVGMVDEPAETGALADSVGSSDDVFVVPAFSGLGAPYWDGRARGTIVGLTRGTSREHVVRATLEAIGFRTRDVLEAMEADAGLDVESLRVDGGSVRNDVLCGIQADVLGTEIVRPAQDETTALGAAYAAGLAAGVWDSTDALREQWRVDARFEPEMATARTDALYERWGEAVERSRDWAGDQAMD